MKTPQEVREYVERLSKNPGTSPEFSAVSVQDAMSVFLAHDEKLAEVKGGIDRLAKILGVTFPPADTCTMLDYFNFLERGAEHAVTCVERAVAKAKKEAFTEFTVWLVNKHGIVVDEELLHKLAPEYEAELKEVVHEAQTTKSIQEQEKMRCRHCGGFH